MKRFLAVVGLVAFVAACSDSSSTAPLRASAGVASHSPGDPPPPPLSGADGSGDLSVGIQRFRGGAQPAIVCSHDFSLSFSWSYLQASGSTNQVVHLDLNGTPSGNIDLHDIQNGKIITHGTVSDALFSFTIQGTDELNSDVRRVLRRCYRHADDLTSGAKCQTSAHLDGTFEPPSRLKNSAI